MPLSDEQLGEMLVNMAAISNKLADKDFIKRQSGDVLSYLAVKLAALKSSIVDLKEDAEKQMLDLEVAKDKAKGEAYQTYKKSDGATAASDMKNMDEAYIEARKKYNASVVQYNKLRSICSDAHDLIDSVKSRVINMQGERKDERLK